jgi:hypothetical protein
MDDDVGRPTLLGETAFSLVPYMAAKPEDALEKCFTLFARDDKQAGELVMKVSL